MRLVVAMCLSGSAADLAQVLDPLKGLGEDLLVCESSVCAGAPSARSQAAAVVPMARFVKVEHAGLAAARNAALAVCDADVLALLDADVLIEPSWLDALTEVWRGIDDAVACVGGPLRVRFEGSRPGWLSDRMTWSLPAFDPKGDPRVVDLTEHSFYGGNVSFRCEALRGVGGFPALRGHARGRDRYDAEHRTQRELGEQGWLGVYLPALAASRLVATDRLTRGEFLRARHRFGARQAIHGDGPTPGQAVRTIVKTSRRAASAVIRSPRDSRLMERADVVAVALGGLTPGLARQDFALDTPNPFRAHGTSGSPTRERARLSRRVRGRWLRSTKILLYHRLSSTSDGRGMTVSSEHFEQHLGVLESRATPLALADIVEAVRRGRVPPGVCITFDDGYVDNLERALPSAQQAGYSPTLFAATGPIEHGGSFYWDEVDDLLIRRPAARDQLTVRCGSDARTWRTATAAQRQCARHHLHAWMQPQSREVTDEMLRQVRAWAGDAPGARAHAPWRPMTIAELREFDDAGGEIGGHTRWHTNLGFQSESRQRDEIFGCRQDLAAWLGSTPAGFAYPYGNPPSDFTRATVELVRRAGYEYAVANVPRVVEPNSNLYALPRFAVPDLDGDEFARWLDRCGR